jgi:ABC-type nitrate/sulfonate/bicarbonate transport system substrate-binding protein
VLRRSLTPSKNDFTSIVPNPCAARPGATGDQVQSWIIANGKFARANPKIVAAFQRAIYRADQYLQNPAHQPQLRAFVGRIAPDIPKSDLDRLD